MTGLHGPVRRAISNLADVPVPPVNVPVPPVNQNPVPAPVAGIPPPANPAPVQGPGQVPLPVAAPGAPPNPAPVQDPRQDPVPERRRCAFCVAEIAVESGQYKKVKYNKITKSKLRCDNCDTPFCLNHGTVERVMNKICNNCQGEMD